MNKGWFKCVLVIVLSLAVFVNGCAAPESAPTAVPATTTVEIPGGQTTIVVDSLGNEVAVPEEVKSVASMRCGITEIICALGQRDKIVAVEEGVKTGTGYGAFIASVYPDLMDRATPLAGHDINAEEMLRINPDVVLHGGYGRIKQAEALKEQVPELPVVIAHFETIENYMDDIRIVAQCVDAEDRAEELIAYLQTRLDFVASRVSDVPEDQKVRVFYGGHDAYHAYGGETFEHSQIVAAGGVNVAEQLTGWMPEVSPEQMLQWDPQVIVLLNGASAEDVLNDPKLSGLSAVKDGRVYVLPEASWDFSSPRALFCIEWLATKLYAEKFVDVDIEADADEFYQAVFGVDYGGPPLADTEQTEGVSSRTITDMMGRQVEIPARPERIVSVFPYVTFTTLALGGEDILVGVDSASSQNEHLAQVYPAVRDLPAVGSAFNVNQESVLMADPELVLTVTWDDDPDETQATLGVPVLCVDLNFYKESIEFIAQVLGGDAEDKASELVSYYEEKRAYIGDRISDVPPAEKTKVYIAGGDGLLSAFGTESTWHYEIEDAGGINVSAELVGGGSHEVSMEQVIIWDPDVIVLDKSCPDVVADVLSDARWQSISAVKEGRVYRAPDGFLDTWGRPHMESALARVWLADKLYPERMEMDIVEEARSFYATFYGIVLSDEEIDGILNPE